MAHHNDDDLSSQYGCRSRLGIGESNDAGWREQDAVPAQLYYIEDSEVCQLLLCQLQLC